MMRAGAFRYHAATSIDDAVAALAGGGPRAAILAGGTDLVPNMKRRQQTPELLVSLRGVHELQGIESNGELTIRAGTLLSDVVADARATSFSALHRAVAQIATPLIRNTATLGGNLCLDTRCNYYNQSYEWRKAIDFCKKAPHGEAVLEPDAASTCWVAPSSPRCWAVASSDAAPALIALGARITLRSAEGEREIALESLFNDDGMAYLTKRPDELLTTIRVPSRDVRSTYWKLRRRGSFDFPVLGVAAALRLHGDVVEEARVVLGAVASRPLLLSESQLLIGRALGDDVIEEFAEKASTHAKPLDNTDFQMTWRKAIAKSYLTGVLRELRGDDPATFPLLAREAARKLAPVW